LEGSFLKREVLSPLLWKRRAGEDLIEDSLQKEGSEEDPS
jgi:hypothetical protein